MSETFKRHTAAQSARRETLLSPCVAPLALATILAPVVIFVAAGLGLGWLPEKWLDLVWPSSFLLGVCLLVASRMRDDERELHNDGYEEVSKLAASSPRVAALVREWTALDARMSLRDLEELRRVWQADRFAEVKAAASSPRVHQHG